MSEAANTATNTATNKPKPVWPWLFGLIFLVMAVGSYFLPEVQKTELKLVADNELKNVTVLTQPKPLALTLQLQDHNNQLFTIDSLKGKWSFLFFGYTSCPDVCPVEMAVLKQVEQLVSVMGNTPKPQIVLVSVDPENDTPEKLNKYLKKFSQDFSGATGSPGEIKRFAKELGIYHEAVSVAGANDHAHHQEHAPSLQINHAATYILINPQAEFHAVLSAPHDAQQIANAYQKITKN